jgi:hypothetical protein
MKLHISIGMLLLAIWLILMGCISVFKLSFDNIGLVTGILAIAAGILLLLGK